MSPPRRGRPPARPSGPSRRRVVVTHALHDLETGAGDALSRAPATADVDECVGVPVQDQRRQRHRSEPFGPGPRGQDPDHLAGHPGRVEASVERLPGLLGKSIGVVVTGAPERAGPFQLPGDGRVAIGGRRTGEDGEGLRRGPTDVRLAGGGHDRGHRQQAIGMVDGELLDDHPAHRHPHDMGPVDSQVVEYGHRVGGHVGQVVGDVRFFSFPERLHHARHVRRDVRELGGQPDVAVVEPDDEEASAHESFAPFRRVVDALGAEAVDHQQGRVPTGPRTSRSRCPRNRCGRMASVPPSDSAHCTRPVPRYTGILAHGSPSRLGQAGTANRLR